MFLQIFRQKVFRQTSQIQPQREGGEEGALRVLKVLLQDDQNPLLHPTHETARSVGRFKNCKNSEHDQPEVQAVRVRGEAGGAHQPPHGDRPQ